MASPKPLKDRITDIGTKSAPSMVPEVKPPAPPKKEEERIPTLAEVVQDRKQRLEIARLVVEHGQLSEKIKPLEKRKEQVSSKLKVLIGQNQIGKVTTGEWRINYYDAARSSIDRDKLLELGVSPAVIAKATVTKSAFTLRVTREKEDTSET